MLTYPITAFDFGYAWQWQSGHLLPLALFGALLALGWRLRWRIWIRALLVILTAWSLAAFLMVRYALLPDRPMGLPTERFLASGTGRVVDLGAGSGRATVMVALARPRASVVALDRFLEGYGIDGNRPERLRANLREAQVEDRVTIQEGDMRQLPWEAASFDAALSAYAIDHLGREGFRTALAEVARILKPGGEFLFFTIHRDGWVKLTYPFLHGGYYGPGPTAERWRRALTDSGAFEVVEQGTQPATLYFLCRKKTQ